MSALHHVTTLLFATVVQVPDGAPLPVDVISAGDPASFALPHRSTTIRRIWVVVPGIDCVTVIGVPPAPTVAVKTHTRFPLVGALSICRVHVRPPPVGVFSVWE